MGVSLNSPDDFSAVAAAFMKHEPRNRIRRVLAKDAIPAELSDAYRVMAPVDVFLRVKGGLSLNLVGLDDLEEAQASYACSPYFVFATLEGDPIAMKGGQVWSAEHGVGTWTFALLAPSLGEFWQQVVQDLDATGD